MTKISMIKEVIRNVHANYRYGVNCGSKIKYSRYRQTLAAHGRQSSDTD
jgi:hypothetical protein